MSHVHSPHAAVRVRMLSLRGALRAAPIDERRRTRLPELRVRASDAPDLDVRGLDVERRLPQLRSFERRLRLRRQLHVRRSLTRRQLADPALGAAEIRVEMLRSV
jgi:hypothetical protein